MHVTAAEVTCDPGWTKCRTVNSCVMDVWMCDGEPDCSDNSDEINEQCGMQYTIRTTGWREIKRNFS